MNQQQVQHLKRFGVWTMTGNPIMVESLARSGAQFLGIDFQHGFMGFEAVAQAIQIANLCQMRTFVRLSAAEHVAWVPRVLDAGADGIIAAMVSGVDDVRRVVDATRYQPHGTRSYGGWRYGLRPEPEDPRQIPVEVHVQVETPAAVEAAPSIAQVSGVAGIYLGPVDLALALSHDYPRQWGDPAWESATERVLNACREYKLISGTFAVSGSEAWKLINHGFDDVVVSSDVAMLRQTVDKQLKIAQGGREETEDKS